MIRQLLGRMHRTDCEPRPVAYVDPGEPLRVDPGTFEAAAALASLAARLKLDRLDVETIKRGTAAPDLAEWVLAVQEIRTPDDARVLLSLGDIQDKASRKAREHGLKTEQGKRYERAAFYAANARTFWQAALMGEV